MGVPGSGSCKGETVHRHLHLDEPLHPELLAPEIQGSYAEKSKEGMERNIGGIVKSGKFKATSWDLRNAGLKKP